MDAAYLEESLELQDIWDVIVISQGMNVVYSTSELSAMWSDGFCCMINNFECFLSFCFEKYVVQSAGDPLLTTQGFKLIESLCLDDILQ